MTAFSFYIPGTDLDGVRDIAHRLKIPNAELDEAFLSESPQHLLTARYESGVRYIALRLSEPAESYTRDDLIKICRWCEANYAEAVLFNNPGNSAERAADIIETTDCFRLKTVFENTNASFLRSVNDMDVFFRNKRQICLCFNPAEMASQRVHPFLSALNGQTYRRQLFMLRAEDRRFNGCAVLPAHGDAELMEIRSSAAAFGLNTWISLSPYAHFTLDEIKTAACEEICKI